VRYSSLDNLVRTKELGFQVADRVYRDYSSGSVVIEERARRLHHEALQAKLISLTTAASCALSKDLIALEQKYMVFESHSALDLEKAGQLADNLGGHLGDLVVTKLRWDTFVHDLGGAQFISDATPAKRAEYIAIKATVQRLLESRDVLHKQVEEAVHEEVLRVALIFDAARTHMQQSASWDICTSAEVEFEASEDLACAEQEAQYAKSALVAPISAHTGSEGPNGSMHSDFRPLVLVVDSRLPPNSQCALMSRLAQYNFHSDLVPLHDASFELLGTVIGQQRNMAVLANLAPYRLNIDAVMTSLSVLVSRLTVVPKVVYLDCTNSVRYSWSRPATLPLAMYTGNDPSAMLGEMRYLTECIRATGHTEAYRHGLLNAPIDTILSSPEGLGAVVSAVVDAWQAPLLPWAPSDVKDGCCLLAESAPYHSDLGEALFLWRLPACDAVKSQRVQLALHLPCMQRAYDCHVDPFPYLLQKWCRLAIRLVDRYVRAAVNKYRCSRVD
jgi:hypothetical protein